MAAMAWRPGWLSVMRNGVGGARGPYRLRDRGLQRFFEQLFEHQQAGSFAEDEAVVLIEGAATPSGRRPVVDRAVSGWPVTPNG